MSYALKKDGSGWRAVSGEEDCQDDEVWQVFQPEIIEPTQQPDISPMEKLKAFLADNPDVANALGMG